MLDVRIIRQATGFSQAGFAAAYRIPPRALEEWEQGKRQPSGAACALLLAIQREPETMRRLLA